MLTVGAVQRDGLPHAAAAVAAHPAGRDLRPVPAGHGLDARASSTCSTPSRRSSTGPGRSRSATATARSASSDVSFAYGDRPPALRRPRPRRRRPGATTAVVGATGSGKTTLVKLLLRFYEPDDGSHHHRRRDPIDSVTLADLRGAIGLVSQDIYLFHGTVRDNIAYGRPDADDDEIVAAAEAAEAHGFVSRAAGRLRHGRRRAGPEALRRPAPAAGDRPGGAQGPGRSSCSTRPPRRSTTRPRPPSSGRWPASPSAAPPWSSPTGSRPCATPTAST